MNVSELVKTIGIAADASYDGIAETARAQLLEACKRLQANLETDREKTLNYMMTPHLAIAIRLGVDLKLFDLPGPSTISTLAAQTNADPLLITRVMRILSGMSLFTETSSPSTSSTYTPSPLAKAYRTGSPYAEAIVHFSTQIEPLAALPRYFAAHGFQSPSDAYNGPFQFARHTELHCFSWLVTQPHLQHAFNTVMSFSRENRGKEWFLFFPVEEKLFVDKERGEEQTLLVDVGGGVGHVLVAFRNKFRSLKGRLVIQDLQAVVDCIEAGSLPKGVEAMGYDFFTEQPVKGAKAYLLRAVLHDWPDKQAREILGRIREAMGKDSVLLVNEQTIPEEGVSLMAAEMDLTMMSGFSSLERTNKQWRDLLESAGLEVVKAWYPDGGSRGESVFEAKLR